jgi:hypothetical protein
MIDGEKQPGKVNFELSSTVVYGKQVVLVLNAAVPIHSLPLSA